MSLREDGLSLYRDGHYAEALDAWLSEERDPAEEPELAYFMALSHVRLGERDEAIRLLGQVLAQDTHLARVYQARMLLAWILIDDGDIGGAERQLREVLQEGFESPQAWSALGYCHWKNGRFDMAVDSYRKAVDLDETNANALNGLGYLLAENGQDLEDAVSLCRKAVEMDPGNVSYRDSLGWALYRSGQISQAVRHLTEALALRPNDGIIKQHLEAIRIHDGDSNS